MKDRLIRLRDWTFAALATLVAGNAHAQCELSVGWEPWPPYQFDDGQGGVTGVDGDLVSAILSEMDCSIQWVESSWNRQLKSVEAGELDAVIGASLTEERTAWGTFSEVYRRAANQLVVSREEAGRYPSLAAFLADGRILGVMREYHYGDEVMGLLAREEYRNQIQATTNAEANLQLLARGRIHGLLMDRFVAAHLIDKLELSEKIVPNALEVSADDLHVLFSKSSVDAADVARFNTVLARLKGDGTIQGIIDTYAK